RTGSLQGLDDEGRAGVRNIIESLRNTESALFGTDPATGKNRTGQQLEDLLLKNAGFGAGISDFSAFEKRNIDLLENQLRQQEIAAAALQEIRQRQLGATGSALSQTKGFATGGLVGGVGNSDSVSALLTPGEFV